MLKIFWSEFIAQKNIKIFLKNFKNIFPPKNNI